MLSETVTQLSSVVDSISRGVADVELRTNALDKRTCELDQRIVSATDAAARDATGMDARANGLEQRFFAVEQQLADTRRQHFKLGGRVAALEGIVGAAKRGEAKVGEGLGGHIMVVAQMNGLENCLKAVEKRNEAFDQRLSVQQEEALQRAESLAEKIDKFRQTLLADFAEHTSSVMRQLRPLGCEVDGCRQRLGEFQKQWASAAEEQSTLKRRVNDFMGLAQAQLDEFVSSSKSDLQELVKAETQRMEQLLGDLASQARDASTESCRADIHSAIEDMRGAQELESRHLRDELHLLLKTWLDGQSRLLASWVAHVSGSSLNGMCSPAVSKRTVDGLNDASMLLQNHLSRLRPSSVDAIPAGGARARRCRGSQRTRTPLGWR